MVTITEMGNRLNTDFIFACLKQPIYKQVSFHHWINLQKDWLEFGDEVFEDLPEFE